MGVLIQNGMEVVSYLPDVMTQTMPLRVLNPEQKRSEIKPACRGALRTRLAAVVLILTPNVTQTYKNSSDESLNNPVATSPSGVNADWHCGNITDTQPLTNYNGVTTAKILESCESDARKVGHTTYAELELKNPIGTVSPGELMAVFCTTGEAIQILPVNGGRMMYVDDEAIKPLNLLPCVENTSSVQP